VAVIDSGVNARHPHIRGVRGGATIGEKVEHDYLDLLGHGTAVMAAIQEKAPDAEYFAARVFYSSLRTNMDFLLRAIEWCIERRVDIVNLSLGTSNPAHVPRFEPVVARARKEGVLLVSALEAGGAPAFPGGLPGVIPVGPDWDCPREAYRYRRCNGALEFYASGYPRSLPGMPKERNLHGISFAVANLTGFLARACEVLGSRDCAAIGEALAVEADHVMEPAPR
jgi:subtilisin family serine protease